MRAAFSAVVLAIAPLVFATPALAQGFDPAPRIAAQKEALQAFDKIDGEWRGEAKTLLPDGSWHTFTQTERVGPMLDGAVKVIEGRGYEADGSTNFNAFAVISYNPDRMTYSIRSYTSGWVGDYPMTPTDTGFTWEVQAGPDMKMSYVATVKDGVWTEIGTRIPKNGPPVKFIEFTVKRHGAATWPAAGAVAPK